MKKRILLVCGSLILISALSYQLVSSKPEESTTVNDDQIDEVYLNVFKKFKKMDLHKDAFMQRQDDLTFHIKRNPFVIAGLHQNRFTLPRLHASAAKSALILNGILWDTKSPMAIISNRIVKTGSRIAHYRVAKITQKKVFLHSQNGNRILTLPDLYKFIQPGQ